MNPAAEHLDAALNHYFCGEPHKGVISMYLFGSRQTGRSHGESDIDVAVLLDRTLYPTRRDRFEERLRLSAALISVLGTNEIDTEILNDAPPSFAAKIVATGRRVFCSDALLDRAFLRDVQLRAADILPFLRRTRRVKLAAIKR